MTMESSNTPNTAGQQSGQVDLTTQQITSQGSVGQQSLVDNGAVLNYEDSPHKAVKPEQQTGDNTIFGKYKSLEDAHKGYQSAEAKIREQGAELNKMKQQMEDYKPMESYTEEKWEENVNKWKEEKALPEGVTYDANIPEISMLIKGFEKAGVSEKQAKAILSGAVERQIALVEERKTEIVKELGSDGMKKVTALQEYCNKLSPEDQVAFSGLFAFPYVESAQVDFMYRTLIGEGERTIPVNIQQAPLKSSTDIYQDIMNFRKTNERALMTDSNLQQQEEAMWVQFNQAKKKGI